MRKVIVMLAALTMLSVLAVSTVDAKKSPAQAPVPQAVFSGNPTVGTLATSVVLSQGAWSTGPSVDVPFGDTFVVWGTVTIARGTATCKLTDGTTDVAISGPDNSISLSGVFNEIDASTLSIDCTGSGIMEANVGTLSGVGSQAAPASTLMVFIPAPSI